MDLLALVTPIVAMACLLVLMQRIETGMTEKVPVENPGPEPRTRAEVMSHRSPAPSSLLAAGPVVVALVTAVLVAGAFVRMAS